MPTMQDLRLAIQESICSTDILASTNTFVKRAGSTANWAKLVNSSSLYLPPNQVNGEGEAVLMSRAMRLKGSPSMAARTAGPMRRRWRRR